MIVMVTAQQYKGMAAFKRLKSLGGFAALRARDPRLARSWLLAHLIAAVLIEASLGEALDFPPEVQRICLERVRHCLPAQSLARMAGRAPASDARHLRRNRPRSLSDDP